MSCKLYLDGQEIAQGVEDFPEITLTPDAEQEEPLVGAFSISMSIKDFDAHDLAVMALAAGITCQEITEAICFIMRAAQTCNDNTQKLSDLAREARRLLREFEPLPRPGRSLPAQAKHYHPPTPKPRPTARAHIRNIRDVKGRTI